MAIIRGIKLIISFSYTLQTPARTSAGVFLDDRLISTLWSNKFEGSGAKSVDQTWDGFDDNGNYVADKEYQIKVVSSNVTYDWLKPIANTSSSATGSTIHRSLQTITHMVQVGTDMYEAVGYNEAGDSHNKFNISAPNSLTTSLRGFGQVTRFLATDGTIVYSAGERDKGTSFVTGIVSNPSGSDTLASFSAGTTQTAYPNGSPFSYSSFDISTSNITGLGVQQSGNYLFTSHSNLDQIRVFNKTTGALVRTITGIMGAAELAVYNNNLWLISATTVAKYTINGDGTISAATLTLSGLTEPLTLAISPDGSKVAVADRGTNHQVKVFNSTTGALTQTIGRAENYSNPAVYNDKFFFRNNKILIDTNVGTTHCFLTYQTDGSIWIGDYGNYRCQHFDASGNYINNIQYMGYLYSVQADINSPTRVFADYLEFSVNYSDNSWVFVRNWSKNITVMDPDGATGRRMRSVVTLSNGRTYCLSDVGNPKLEVWELDNTTGIRYTGIRMDTENCELNSDGSQWQMGTNDIGSPTYWKRRPLTGFDSNNNPQWGAYVTLETTPNVILADPLTADGGLKRNQVSSTGVIASFSSDNGTTTRGRGYHLGGVKNGQWVFRSSPSTRPDYRGGYPVDGAYDIGNDVKNAGSFMQVIDRHIFWGYIGESWKDSQVNKYAHYLDNGLMLGQFGQSGDVAKTLGDAPAMMAGNANSGTYVKVGSDIHFFHGDEGWHTAIHHWKISGLNTIKEYLVTINKPDNLALPPNYIDLMAGIPVNGSINDTIGRLSFAPTPYQNLGKWAATAGLFTYRRGERSVNFESRPESNGLIRDAKWDLSVINGQINNLTSWLITMELTYAEASEPDDNFLDVIDNSGKVIVRISRVEIFPNASLKVNSTTIVSGDLTAGAVIIFTSTQPLSIFRNGSNIFVKYGTYAQVSVNALDAGANLSAPTTLRVRHFSETQRGHQTGISNARLYTS